MRKHTLLSIFLSLFSASVLAQSAVSGKVTDAESGDALLGVTVLIKGSTKGTTTNGSGEFSLPISEGNLLTLVFRMVGYRQAEQIVNAGDVVNIALLPSETMLNSTIVYALRDYPITKTELKEEAIEKQNFGQDLPVQLNFQPSVVTTTDAGAGVGYTGLRIRGTDPTRINVTINGIPVNDAESQGVFWVNTPDLASSVSNAVIQRGVGTSTNGAGAFGASLNLTTQQPDDMSSFAITNGYGSFNTWRHNVEYHSGLLNHKFKFYGRLSKITSDGYIDNAWADLRSFYLSGMYTGKAGNLTLNIFSGKEQTFQAWNGVSEEKIKSGDRTFNELAGYDNEIDNYQQDHYQLLYQKEIGQRISFNSALFLTQGRGYFEQYKAGEEFEDYGISVPDPFIVNGEEITETDVIVRRWLDNDFYGGIFSFDYNSAATKGNSPTFNLVTGGGWKKYEGAHFGEVIWSEFVPQNNIRDRYYDNNAVKTDFNLYSKFNFQPIENLFVFADLQIRKVNYEFVGPDLTEADTIRLLDQSDNMTFFNPKFGLRYSFGKNEIYTTFGISNKEPNRDDYTETTLESRPEHETLRNLEIGFSRNLEKVAFNINGYYMDYQNQLVLTGQINDVGDYTRTNIPDSYRLGLELQGKVSFSPKVDWEANATFSQNRIKSFTEYIDNYDTGIQEEFTYSDTDLAFSPNLIAGSQLTFRPTNGLEIGLLSKFVNEQFLDNTSNQNRMLDSYFTQDIRLSYSFKTSWSKSINLKLLVNNIFNEMYESNGYTYGYIWGGENTRVNYYYPQAGTNFMSALEIRF